MKRLRTICTVACLVLAMAGLAHADISMNVTLTPNPIARWTSNTLTVTTSEDIDMVEIYKNEFMWFDFAGGGTFTSDIGWGLTGIYEVIVKGIINGDVVAQESILLAVYNPDAGFVTGAGWIDSPAGAYASDPSLTGRAHFAFLSKYNKGATTPTGHTGFVFKAGDFSFQSSSYDWLVVNLVGTNAQFKGSGTINGEAGYKFMLWAKDGDGVETDFYDNGSDQSIGGGSIIVHTSKKKVETCPLCGGAVCVPPCPNAGT